MTFKLLIVDDEPIISRGLRLTIPWEAINVEVVDTAYDGEDAIKKIEQYGDIDIVITDVRMPKVDGLQLARFLYTNYPHIRTIILSGFDEFEYAQQAIKWCVGNYFLKPVNIDELMENVQKITGKIKEEQQQRRERNDTNLRNAILQQITDLQRSGPTKLDLSNGFMIYPFISMHQNYMRIKNNLTDAEYEEFLIGWENTIESELQKDGLASYSFFTEENILFTCVHSEDWRKMTPEMMRNLFQNDGATLRIVWNDEWTPVEKLKVVLAELIHKGRFLPLTDNPSLVVSDQYSRGTNQAYPTKLEKKLIDTVIQMKDIDLHSVTRELLEYFSLHEFFLEEAVQVCRELLNKVLHHYESLGGRKGSEWELSYRESVNVHVYNSYELLEDLLYQDLSFICKEQSEFKNLDKQDVLIDHAKKYIQEFYRTDINVHEVAEVINISPNYFSSLFKQKTSVNFNEYVNQLRVNEAKILLAETPFKVSEISEQVGFHEYKYFVGVFKKLTGMTATDYRKYRSLQD